MSWQDLDYLRREVTRQEDEIRRLRIAVAEERRARYTAEMQLAVLRGDSDAWLAAMKEREAI